MSRHRLIESWRKPVCATLLVLAFYVPARAATLTLQWDPSTDTQTRGYILSYGPSAGVYTSKLRVGKVTIYTVSGLASDTKYCFAVRAHDGSGALSAYSNAVCATTPPPPPPPPEPSPTPSPSTSPVTIKVNAGGSFQAALDAARPGDTILLEAGATFVGNFILRRKSSTSTSYITIRSSAASSTLPASGVRMTPAYTTQLPKLRSPNSAPALRTESSAHHYRLLFLEFLPNAVADGSIIALGDGSAAQNTLGVVPHHLILDRVYIHGDATRGQRRGITLNSASTNIINSHISNIKTASVDSQAIASWNGPGPYVISNNYIEAAGKNVIFGVVPPHIPNLVPTGITLTRNHVSKQLVWKGQSWRVDNLLEIKNARNVTIDGNVLENSWTMWGSGFAVLFYAANTAGTSTPWSAVHELKFTNNTVRNVSSALYISRGPAMSVETASGFTIRNNLFSKVSSALNGGLGIFLAVAGATAVTVDHNTIVNDGYGLLAQATVSGMIFTNNVMVDHGGAIIGSGTSAGRPTITKFFPGGQFLGGMYVGANATVYPVGNYYPGTISSAGFVNWTGGDYRLSLASIYNNGGTDGKDPGCDFATLAAAQN